MAIRTIAPREAYNDDGSFNRAAYDALIAEQADGLTAAEIALINDTNVAIDNVVQTSTTSVADINNYLAERQATQRAIYDTNAAALANYAREGLTTSTSGTSISGDVLQSALRSAMIQQNNIFTHIEQTIETTTRTLETLGEAFLADRIDGQPIDNGGLASSFRDYIERSDNRLENVLRELREQPQEVIFGFGDNGGTLPDGDNGDENLLKNVLVGILDSGILGGIPAIENKIDEFIPDLEQLGADIEKVLGYLHNLNVAFQSGNIETLDDFEALLFRGVVANSVGDGLIRLINIVPFIFKAIQSFSANSNLQLDKMVNRSIHPTFLDLGVLLTSYHRNFIDRDRLTHYLSSMGYSPTDILRLISTSHQRYTLADSLELLRRKEITEDVFRDNLKDLGYTQNQIEEYVKLRWFVPPVQDVIKMAVRDVFDPTIVAQGGLFNDLPRDFVELAELSGIDNETAKLYWGAHWQIPSLQQGYRMLHRSVIDDTGLDTLFKAADIAPNWRDKLKAISYSVPTRVDTRRMFETGIIDETQVKRLLKDFGYNDIHAQSMLEWYIERKRERDNRDTNDTRNLTVGLITRAYINGIIEENVARSKLSELGFNNADISIIISDANARLDDDTVDNYTKLIRNRYLKLAEKYYMDGAISESDTIQFLQDAGLSLTEANGYIALLDLAKELDRKDAIIQQVKKLYVGYEITDAELQTILLQYGFSNNEVQETLVSLEPFRHLRYKDLTRADVKKLLSIGIIDLDSALNQYRGLGYSDNDISLILKLEQDIDWVQ